MLFDDNLGFIAYSLYPNMMNDNNTSNNSDNNSDLVSVSEGFMKGNMFASEYKPYKNYACKKIIPKTKKEEELLEIMELSFAINDLNLYLDLHPHDREMLEKFNKLVEISCQKEMEYVKTYGPLEVIDSDSSSSFEWIKNPWPWEREDDTKYV